MKASKMNVADEASDKDDDEEEEEDTTSDSVSIDAKAIQSKFETLAAALQATNQNLVTFEYLMELSKKQEKKSSPKTDQTKDDLAEANQEDIVNLLKDICGSVNDLRSEMGQNIKAVEVKKLDSYRSNPENSDLKDKCNKLEFEVECLREKLTSTEEKYLEEKRKTVNLEEIVQELKGENRKLGLYLKEADNFSKESERECHYLKKEILDVQKELQKESLCKESLQKDLEDIKKLYSEYETKVEQKVTVEKENEKLMQKVESLEIELQTKETENKDLIDDVGRYKDYIEKLENDANNFGVHVEIPPLNFENIPSTSRSLISSKSDATDEKTHDELRDSYKRLKSKTRKLLNQYRFTAII